jgi:hypothetical protein
MYGYLKYRFCSRENKSKLCFLGVQADMLLDKLFQKKISHLHFQYNTIKLYFS